MPPVFITYSLAYLDRANYGFGAAAGMAKTLHITDSRSALLGALFFLGYFFFQFPGASYARRHSVGNLVFWTQLAWGALAALTGIIQNFWLLAADRLLLGVAESFILPSLLILLTDWFTSEERSRTNTLLILGNPITVLWMSAVTGYLIKVVGWQMAFVLEGIPSMVWAFFWLRLIRDKPEQARWMGEEHTHALAVALDKEQQKLPPVASVAHALRMRNVLILSAQFFLWSVGVYGFVLWLPSIIQTGGSQGIGITGLLSAVPYLLAAVLMVIVSYFSDRSRRRKRYIWPFLIAAAAALFLSYLTVGQSFWLAYLFLVLAGAGMYAPYGPFFAYVPDMLPRNVSGQTMAFINSLGALGAFVGAWFVGVLQSATHNSEASFLAMALAIFLSGTLMLFVHSATNAKV
jgi:MFS family permease